MRWSRQFMRQSRCGPVTRPDLPRRATTSSWRTRWPTATSMLSRCRKVELRPWPWSMMRVAPEKYMSGRSEEHTSELQSLMRISYAVFCLQKKKTHKNYTQPVEEEHHNTLQKSEYSRQT